MVPKGSRPAVLAHAPAVDALALRLYREPSARRRAALRREVDDLHEGLHRLLGVDVIEAGDLRR
jgi:hypothetical protein